MADKTRQTGDLVSDNNIFVDIVNDRVGIGTTNPSAKLHVSGGDLEVNSLDGIDVDIKLGVSAGDNNFSIIRNSRISNSQSSLSFYINDVGFYNAFQLDTNSAFSFYSKNNWVTSAYTGKVVEINLSDQGTRFAAITTESESVTDRAGALILKTKQASGAGSFAPQERVRITSVGNVGIGTTNPTYKLQVEGDIKLGELGTLWFSDVAGSVEKIVGSSGELNLYADADIQFYESDSNTRRFTVDVNNGELDLGSDLDTTTAQVHIDHSGNTWFNGGNVGIGTTSPSVKLEVYGDLRIKATDGSHGIEFYPDIAALGYQRIISYNRTSSAYEDLSIGANNFIITSGASVETLRASSTGNVGIGTTNPTDKLHVEGNINIKGNVIGGELTGQIADDAMNSYTTPTKGGILAITSFSTYQDYPQPSGTAIVYYDVGVSRNIQPMALPASGSGVETSTNTSTTITDFTDGKLTIVAVATNTIRLVNRLGGTYQFKLTWL